MKRIAAMLLAVLLLTSCAAKPPVEKPDKPQEPPKQEEPAKKPEKKPIQEEPQEEDPAPAPDPEPEPEPEPDPASQVPSGSKRFYVKVNCQTNSVTIYERDDEGKYTIPYMAMICSSGLDAEGPDMATCMGEYTIGYKWEWLDLVDNVSGMYATQFNGDYLFHSVPYTESGNHGSLKEGEFDKLGSDASHGCIRLQVSDAKWIYDHADEIEAVLTYNSSDPGPLGKPKAPKIGNSEHPGWDPSDPHSKNPWKK